jgi:membrane protein YqaA with SNARE-associated domain
MLRRLYDSVLRLAASPRAPAALFVVSFLESSFFPVPPDAMLAPMVLTRPEKAWRYALICTVASVLGGMLGYVIGFYLDGFATWLLALIGHAEGPAVFQAWFEKWGLWVILIKGLTPIPYKLVTIASGLAHFSFLTFVIASIVTRGARFFMVAYVVKTFGPGLLPVIEKRLALIAGLVVAAVAALLIWRHFA